MLPPPIIFRVYAVQYYCTVYTQGASEASCLVVKKTNGLKHMVVLVGQIGGK
jgi:hypothetical protein